MMQHDLFATRSLTVFEVACRHSTEMSAEFLEWLPDNLHIWRAFVEQANHIIARGFKHYSSRTIVEFLRHHTALQQNSGGEWKINDHNVPYLSRLFDLCFPEKAGLFEYRITTKKKGIAA